MVGRGLCGRWEVGYEVEPEHRNAGRGRRLVAAARRLVPAGEPLFAQVAPAQRGVDAFDPRGRVRARRRGSAVRLTSPAMSDFVLTERHDDGVALLRLNRPPMNPLSIAVLGELRDAAPRSRATPT